MEELRLQQLEMRGTANKMAHSITDVLEKVNESQIRHETVIKLHSDALAVANAQNHQIAAHALQADQLAAKQQIMIGNQQAEAQSAIMQAQQMFQSQHDRIGQQEDTSQAIKSYYQSTKEANRNRSESSETPNESPYQNRTAESG